MRDGPDAPLQHRQPRRGDKVVPAPYGDVEIEGVVVCYTTGRLTLHSARDGRLTLPMLRFTWKPKARHWVCWPADITRHMKAVHQAEDQQARARYGLEPRVGDYCLVSGRGGWISHLYARPVKAADHVGAIFHEHAGYEITTAAGPVRIQTDQITFDVEKRVWVSTT